MLDKKDIPQKILDLKMKSNDPNKKLKIQKLQQDEDENPVLMATFDCEIVRGYRELHIDDINLRKVSNRDLVLKLGMGFEEMGQEVLQKIGDKDPLFLRFYRSLKEVQETPLN